MVIGDVILCCNGEIYNFKELAEKYQIKLHTRSNCEIIIHLYHKFGIEETCKLLDGKFSFMVYDKVKKELLVVRDHLGLRGLFFGTINKSFAFSSEAKTLGFCNYVQQFYPRMW